MPLELVRLAFHLAVAPAPLGILLFQLESQPASNEPDLPLSARPLPSLRCVCLPLPAAGGEPLSKYFTYSRKRATVVSYLSKRNVLTVAGSALPIAPLPEFVYVREYIPPVTGKLVQQLSSMLGPQVVRPAPLVAQLGGVPLCALPAVPVLPVLPAIALPVPPLLVLTPPDALEPALEPPAGLPPSLTGLEPPVAGAEPPFARLPLPPALDPPLVAELPAVSAGACPPSAPPPPPDFESLPHATAQTTAVQATKYTALRGSRSPSFDIIAKSRCSRKLRRSPIEQSQHQP